MNLLDIKVEVDKSKDLLKQVYEKQLELCKEVDPESIDAGVYTRKGQERVKKYIFYAVEELMELSNKMKLRPWVQTEYIPDINEIYDELADSYLMFLLVCISLGVSPEKLTEIALKKIEVNRFRRETKY